MTFLLCGGAAPPAMAGAGVGGAPCARGVRPWEKITNPEIQRAKTFEALKLIEEHGARAPAEKLEQLVRTGADPELFLPNESGTNLLMALAGLYNADGGPVQHITLGWLIGRNAKASLQNSLGEKPLDYAIEAGNSNAVKTLLAAGVSPEQDAHSKSTKNLWPALVRAVALDSMLVDLPKMNGERGRIVDLLLKYRAGVNASGPYGLSAIHFAVEGGNYELARDLLDLGANENPRLLDDVPSLSSLYKRHDLYGPHFKKGAGPLQIAAARRDGHMLQFLLEFGEPVCEQDKKAIRDPIMFAMLGSRQGYVRPSHLAPAPFTLVAFLRALNEGDTKRLLEMRAHVPPENKLGEWVFTSENKHHYAMAITWLTWMGLSFKLVKDPDIRESDLLLASARQVYERHLTRLSAAAAAATIAR
jgi:ankyrin repeat protein